MVKQSTLRHLRKSGKYRGALRTAAVVDDYQPFESGGDKAPYHLDYTLCRVVCRYQHGNIHGYFHPFFEEIVYFLTMLSNLL